MNGLVFLLGAYFAVPIVLTVVLVRPEPFILFLAYAVWIGLLTFFGLLSGGTSGEKFGWPLIMGLFFTTPAIPIISLVFKLIDRVRRSEPKSRQV